MKKQLLLLVMAILPLFANASVSVVYINGIHYYLYNNSYSAEASVTKAQYHGSIVIPQSVTYGGVEYSVTKIMGYAFEDCSGLTSITIPNSVTSIGEYAFHGCTGLTSITIPNSVTSIERYAFWWCTGLTSITIPNSVTSIGEFTFRGCSSLTSIIFPNSVISFGSGAFEDTAWYDNQPDGIVYAGKIAYNYKGIMPPNTNIVLEEGTLKIAESAFSGCGGLTSISIPNSVTSIGEYAFQNCIGLTNVTIGNSVTCIGNYAFYGCNDLTSITIPNSVTTIGDFAFQNCSGLTSITIPNSVISIGRSTFQSCSGLASITIPNSVTTIGDYTFYNCSSLTSITIPNSVTSIGWRVFMGCSGLMSVTIPESVTSIEESAFEGCTGLTKITIPNSVTNIGDYAFRGCSGLTNITIGNFVTSIGSSAFKNCSRLTSVNISDVAAWCNIKFADNLSNPLSYAKSLYINGEKAINLIIPNSVTSIGNYTFYNCSSMTSITIPNFVTSIGESALYGCSGLTSLIIPNSVTSIDASAFQGCRKMSSVVLSNELKLIKANTFNGCTSLSSITIPETVEVIYQQAFAGCNLTEVKVLATTPPFAYDNTFSNYSIPLYVPEASVSDYQSANPWSKFSSLKTLAGGDVEVLKCATPIISYDNGRIVFSCATEGVEYSSSITDADIKNYATSSIQLGTTYTIRVIATKSGYQNSDEATATLSWNGISPIMTGETAKYRLSFIVDNKELSVRNVAYGTRITAPSTDSDGNTVSWYTYPATMPAHDLVVYGMVMKPEPAPAPTKYTLTYILDGQQYKQETIEEGAMVAKETEPSKEGYTFSGWQNEPTTMPAQNTTVTGRFTINSYRLSFIAENRELSSKNVTYGSQITAPSTDGEGNIITWYTYPATMPAHDLVVYGMVVKQPEPEVLVWLTVKDGQGTTRMKVRQGTEQVLTITPEEGWKVVSVTWNGTDVTAQVKDGSSYTTPAITNDATLIVVYEQDAPSDVASARAGQATVKVVDDGVVITHAEPQSRCVVYTSNGEQVVSTVIEGDSQKIRLQKGQVYILTINGRTLKFAL